MNADHRGYLLLAAGLVLAGCSHARRPPVSPVGVAPSPSAGTTAVVAPPAPGLGAGPASPGTVSPLPPATAASAWGATPRQVEVDVGAAVARHVERVRAGDLTAVSTTARLAPFDAEAYRADPAAYLGRIEPARIWQVADEGPGIRPLTTADGATAAAYVLAQGATQLLAVRTEAGWPVTFGSLDMGVFANGLTTQTVQADATGLATVAFTATPGTIAEVRVVAASPVASGQVDLRLLIPVESAPTR